MNTSSSKASLVLVFAIATYTSTGVAGTIYGDFTMSLGGNGAPSDSFSAASNTPGMWNPLIGLERGPQSLFDIEGRPTTAQLTVAGSNLSGGSGLPLSGDILRLLGDYVAGDAFTMTFSGLEFGTYDVYTYARAPLPNGVTNVTARGETQQVTSMPFIDFMTNGLGETYALHRISISSSTPDLILEIDNTGSRFRGYVNGFQIIGASSTSAVPEPSSLFVFLGVFMAAFRRTRRTPHRP